jgi:hypothetical protein
MLPVVGTSLNLNATHQHLVYADDNLLGNTSNINTINKNTGPLTDACKAAGHEVNREN